MEIVKNFSQLLMGITIICGFIACGKALIEKKLEQIALIILFTAIISGFIIYPEFLPKIGGALIQYLCHNLKIEGVV
jgi:hypothetical protein